MVATSEARALQTEFWGVFDSFRERNPKLGFDLSRQRRDMRYQPHITKLEWAAGSWEVCVRFNVAQERIEADLTLSGADAKSHFDALFARFAATGDEEVGSPAVNWERQDGKTESSINMKRDVRPAGRDEWEAQAAWLVMRAATLLRWAKSI